MYFHQIWLQGESNLPQDYVKYSKMWKEFCIECKYTYKIWSEEEIKKLIKDNFPHLLNVYLNYPIFVQKADLGRYVILYLYGGIYIDMDTYPKDKIKIQKIINKIQNSNKDLAFLKTEFYFPILLDSKIRNWFLYVKNKKDPFYLYVLKEIPKNKDRKLFCPRAYYVAKSTGSKLLTNCLFDLNNSFMSKSYLVNTKELEGIHNEYRSSWGGAFKFDRYDFISLLIIVIVLILLFSRPFI